MRHVNRILAALLALTLFLASILIIVEVIADHLNGQPALVNWHSSYDWLGQHTWGSGSVRVACIGIALVGVILLVAELKPHRPSRLAVDSDDTDAAYTRRGVAASVRRAVLDVEGISHAHVKVGRRRIQVDARTRAQQTSHAEELKGPVTAATTDRLADLELISTPKVSVHIVSRSS